MIINNFFSKAFSLFENDMRIKIVDYKIEKIEYETLKLNDFTSMIGIGGHLNLIAVINFDIKLLDELVSIFMDDEEVELDEFDLIRESVSGEMLNTIIGHFLMMFSNEKSIAITPPITISAKSSKLKKHKNSSIICFSLKTRLGMVYLNIIGDKKVIDNILEGN